MNIFKRKKALLARIADLEAQISVQSKEMDNIRTANTDINRLWREAVKENKLLKDETLTTKEAMRAMANEHADAIGEKNKTIEQLENAVADKERFIAELQDTTSGLASSVSDLKAKLKAKTARVTALTKSLEEIKAKTKAKSAKKTEQ